MAKIVTKVRKAGGSLILTIPKDVRDSLSIKEDQLVEVDVTSPKIDFCGAIPKLDPFSDAN